MSEFWNPERSKEDSLLINYTKSNYKNVSLSQLRQLLPIYSYRNHILYALERYNVVVLVSSTGTGKSTQIPQYLYEAGWAKDKSILCTQPRRLAAIAIATRVAQEMGCVVGDRVGYSIRFDRKVSDDTKIKYCTDGVLIREMMSDPLLEAYSVVIVDEAHQRSLNTDILFGLLKKILRKRPSLRVVISSATMDASLIKDFFEINQTKAYDSYEGKFVTTNATTTIASGGGGHTATTDSGSLKMNEVTIATIDSTDSAAEKVKGSSTTATTGLTAPSGISAHRTVKRENAVIVQLPMTDAVYSVDVLYLKTPCRDYLQCTVDTILSIHTSATANSGSGDSSKSERSRVVSTQQQQQLNGDGDILVFLPGKEEIDTVSRLLHEHIASIGDIEYQHQYNQSMYQSHTQSHSKQKEEPHTSTNKRSKHNTYNNSTSSSGSSNNPYDNLYVVKLYANLSTHSQLQVFHQTPANKRKIILATNIAETSLTIEGVRYVVDSCLVKLNYYDFIRNIDMLLTMPVAKASAWQRAGRCGRVQAGQCYRLITETDFYNTKIIPLYTQPEMQRVDITWSLLQLKALGIKDIIHFDYISPPSVNSVLYSVEMLYCLEALDAQGELTETGRHMAEMSIEPKLSKCLLKSYEYGCTEELLSIVSMMSVDNPWNTTAMNLTTSAHSASDTGARARSTHPHSHSSGSSERKKHIESVQKELLSMEGDAISLLLIYRAFHLVYTGHTTDSSSKSSSSGGRQHGLHKEAAISWCDSHHLQHKVMFHAYEIRRNLESMIRHYTGIPSTTATATSDNSAIDASINAATGDGVSSVTGRVRGVTGHQHKYQQRQHQESLPIASCVDDFTAVKKCLLSSFFMNIAKQGPDGEYYTVKGDVKFSLHSSSVYANYGIPPTWVMYNELVQHTVPQMRDVTSIEPLWLLQTAGHYYDIMNLTYH